ncbi:unnamed protein product, partial [Didymodactylos carnosus]
MHTLTLKCLKLKHYFRIKNTFIQNILLINILLLFTIISYKHNKQSSSIILTATFSPSTIIKTIILENVNSSNVIYNIKQHIKSDIIHKYFYQPKPRCFTSKQQAQNEIILRAILIYFSYNQIQTYLSELKWLYLTWIEILNLQSSKWITDILIFTDYHHKIFGQGGYSDSYNIRKLHRLSYSIGLNYSHLVNIGSTWYGNPSKCLLVARLGLWISVWLAEQEFTEYEKSPKTAAHTWPDWYFGVLSMYAVHLAINHYSLSGLNLVQIPGLLDFSSVENVSLVQRLQNSIDGEQALIKYTAYR